MNEVVAKLMADIAVDKYGLVGAAASIITAVIGMLGGIKMALIRNKGDHQNARKELERTVAKCREFGAAFEVVINEYERKFNHDEQVLGMLRNLKELAEQFKYKEP